MSVIVGRTCLIAVLARPESVDRADGQGKMMYAHTVTSVHVQGAFDILDVRHHQSFAPHRRRAREFVFDFGDDGFRLQ